MSEAKNVLVISGSARKGGNSDRMADAFCEGAREAGHTAEKVNIGTRMSIGGCLGCDGCRRGGGTCVQRDDMAVLYEKIAAADVVAIATPVYFYTWSAQTKAFLDRLYAVEPSMRDKVFYLLASCAAPEERYLDHLKDAFHLYIHCFDGSVTEGGMAFATGTIERGSVEGNPGLADARALGLGV